VATINGYNWTFPGVNQDIVSNLARMSGDNAVPNEARAYYVLGNLLPYLSGSAFNSALNYLQREAASAGQYLIGGDLSPYKSQFENAQTAMTNLVVDKYNKATPGLIGAQVGRVSAATALTNLMNQLQSPTGQGTGANQSSDPWGNEMGWLRQLANLSSRKPRTAQDWADYDTSMAELRGAAKNNTNDTSSSAYDDLAQWFANPVYNSPTVSKGMGNATVGGARNWWK
jgi:hypothetical protein